MKCLETLSKLHLPNRKKQHRNPSIYYSNSVSVLHLATYLKAFKAFGLHLIENNFMIHSHMAKSAKVPTGMAFHAIPLNSNWSRYKFIRFTSLVCIKCKNNLNFPNLSRSDSLAFYLNKHFICARSQVCKQLCVVPPGCIADKSYPKVFCHARAPIWTLVGLLALQQYQLIYQSKNKKHVTLTTHAHTQTRIPSICCADISCVDS